MTHDALLMSANAQYREMLQIGTWLAPEPKKHKGATFKAEDELDPPGKPSHGGDLLKKCRSCYKFHSGACHVHWKILPPKPGDPHTKVQNEKKYFWCDKCTQWNLTHVTDSHRSREEASVSANITTEDDDASLGTGGGSANFTSYDMRNLSLGRNPSAQFAGALRSGLRRSHRWIFGRWFAPSSTNTDHPIHTHLCP